MFFNNDNNFDDLPTNTKPSEIIYIIKNFKIRTAPGREGITTKMCKHFISNNTTIINNILKVGYFPQLWKTVSVIPILKPGKDPTIPDSFPPISLLSVLSKITEKIIQKRLRQHLPPKPKITTHTVPIATPPCHILPTNQETLIQPGPSTSDHINKLDMGRRNASRSISQRHPALLLFTATREATHSVPAANQIASSPSLFTQESPRFFLKLLRHPLPAPCHHSDYYNSPDNQSGGSVLLIQDSQRYQATFTIQ
ncbi:RNA-directed DNA polymerase from mobile element jockey [Trichonephila clavipes]|nr:RNA-directed DNA polymerase from mobile element jockey [Trichonephila clavipes]